MRFHEKKQAARDSAYGKRKSKETVRQKNRYPLLKDTLTYTEYFAEVMVFNDIVAVHRYIEKHGLEKLATVIKGHFGKFCIKKNPNR